MEKNKNEFKTFLFLKKMGDREITKAENSIRFLNLILIFISCCLIYYNYSLEHKILKLNFRVTQSENIFTSDLAKHLLFDLLICLICLPPYLNYVVVGEYLGYLWSYNINSIISLIVIGKLYFVLKFIKLTSKWTSDLSSSISKKYNVRTGVILAVKCEFKDRPFLLLGCVFFLIFMISSFVIRTFEFGVKKSIDRTFIGDNQMQTLSGCFHFIVFSMTTVGYGDFTPKSILGRSIAIISCIVGNLLIALIIASLAVLSEFTNGEKKAYSIIKKLIADDNAKTKAANVIFIIIRLRNSVCKTNINRNDLKIKRGNDGSKKKANSKNLRKADGFLKAIELAYNNNPEENNPNFSKTIHMINSSNLIKRNNISSLMLTSSYPTKQLSNNNLKAKDFTPKSVKSIKSISSKEFQKNKNINTEKSDQNKIIKSKIYKAMVNSQINYENSVSLIKQRFIILTELKRMVHIFKNDYKLATSYSLPIDEMLNMIDLSFKNNVETFKSILKNLEGCDCEVLDISETNKLNKKKIKSIIKMQDDVFSYLININNIKYKSFVKEKNQKLNKN